MLSYFYFVNLIEGVIILLHNKKGCRIVFDKNMKFAKNIINEWFKRGKIKTKRLDLILSKLDFNHDGKVYLFNNERCEDSFYYSLDGINYNFDILLLFPRRICVRSSGKEVLYEYVEDPLAEDGFRMIKVKSRRGYYSNGVYCVSEILSESQIDYNSLLVYNKDFSIHLNISYDRAIKLSRGEAIELDNYLELEKYLTSLTFPCSILDVYKKICEISLTDVNKYSSLSLSFSRKLDENNKIETDKIYLCYGDLFELKMTTLDGKVINMYQTGDFSYTLTDETVSFSVKELRNDQVSYSVTTSTDKKMDDYMDGLMTYDINIARRELGAAKKKVREMFPNLKR